MTYFSTNYLITFRTQRTIFLCCNNIIGYCDFRGAALNRLLLMNAKKKQNSAFLTKDKIADFIHEAKKSISKNH